jgi:CRP-like cAMP-binding protein
VVQALIDRISQHDSLSAEEIAALRRLPARTLAHPAGTDIAPELARPHVANVVLSGVAGRYKMLRDGARQILALHVAGDFVDLHGFLLKQLDHGVVAISDCEVAQVPHDRLLALTEAQPHLSRLLWISTLIDGAMLRMRVAAMGRLTAEGQMAHFLCETYTRLAQVGIAADFRFELPLTQTQLADTLGLSSVHVNRVLQRLRAMGLVWWEKEEVDILDWNGLAALGNFDPSYLTAHAAAR